MRIWLIHLYWKSEGTKYGILGGLEASAVLTVMTKSFPLVRRSALKVLHDKWMSSFPSSFKAIRLPYRVCCHVQWDRLFVWLNNRQMCCKLNSRERVFARRNIEPLKGWGCELDVFHVSNNVIYTKWSRDDRKHRKHGLESFKKIKNRNDVQISRRKRKHYVKFD